MREPVAAGRNFCPGCLVLLLEGAAVCAATGQRAVPMRGIVSARRRAEEFAHSVDTGTLSSGAPSDTRSLIELVQQMRAMDPVETRPDFATDLRTRLMAEAPRFLTLDDAAPAAASVSLADRRTMRGRRALSAAAAACIVLGGSVGVAAASQTALPGESLYSVKRGIERLEVATAGSAAGRGHELLQQADNRLSEIEQLALTQPDDYATPLLMRDALEDFSSAAHDGGDDLITAYGDGASEATISELRQFTADASRRLDAMIPMLPADLRDELIAAAEDLSTLDSTAHQACPTCSTLAPLQLSSALTTLREPLDAGTSDPVVKPRTPADTTKSPRVDRPNAPTNLTQGPGLPSPTVDPPSPTVDPTSITLPGLTSSAPVPSNSVSSTAPPASQSTSAAAAPGSTPALPQPSSSSNTQPGPAVPSVDVDDVLDDVPEVLDPGDVVDVPGDVPKVLDPGDVLDVPGHGLDAPGHGLHAPGHVVGDSRSPLN